MNKLPLIGRFPLCIYKRHFVTFGNSRFLDESILWYLSFRFFNSLRTTLIGIKITITSPKQSFSCIIEILCICTEEICRVRNFPSFMSKIRISNCYGNERRSIFVFTRNMRMCRTKRNSRESVFELMRSKSPPCYANALLTFNNLSKVININMPKCLTASYLDSFVTNYLKSASLDDPTVINNIYHFNIFYKTFDRIIGKCCI